MMVINYHLPEFKLKSDKLHNKKYKSTFLQKIYNSSGFLHESLLILILFLFNSAVLLCSLESSGDIYKYITYMTPAETAFINDDLKNADHLRLIRYYILISEDTSSEPELINFYLKKSEEINRELLNTFGTLNFSSLSQEKRRNAAEKILTLLHEHFFIRYSLNSDRFSEIMNGGFYNCVSSSIMYSIFLHRYGFSFQAIETDDHVFITVNFDDNVVDVETTNKYGFNPGTKKEFHDEFGRLTGFTYVPSKSYPKSFVIDFKRIFFLAVQNRAAYLAKERKQIDALKAAFFVKTGRNDSKGNDIFNIHFTNMIRSLMQSNNEEKALELINLYSEKNGYQTFLTPLRYDVISKMSLRTGNEEGLLKLKKRITDEHNRYSEKDNRRFEEAASLINAGLITLYNSSERFTESFALITEYPSNRNRDVLINNTFHSITAAAQSSGSYEEAFRLLKSSSDWGLDKSRFYQQYSFALVNNYTAYLTDKKRFEEALNLLKNHNFQSDNRISILMKNVYTNYGYTEFQSGNYDKAIELSLEALEIFKNDRTLRNNLIFYFSKIIEDAVIKGDSTLETRYKKRAAEIFPGEQRFK